MEHTTHREPLFEAMALCGIADEIMSSEADAAISYPNNVSSMSGVGSYVVQSLIINGVQRSLPTLTIFTEIRENLKHLELTILQIFSTALGNT